jgi:hypothetical protein
MASYEDAKFKPNTEKTAKKDSTLLPQYIKF